MGNFLTPTEPRIKVNLFVSGFMATPAQSGLTRRVVIPTLMIYGDSDHLGPIETKVHPMFDLLGTSPEHKKSIVLQGGHMPPWNETIRLCLDWLDLYQTALPILKN